MEAICVAGFLTMFVILPWKGIDEPFET